MISVVSVKLEELTNDELGLLAKYCAKCFEPVSCQDLVNRVRSGLACIYRFTGDCSGVFVLAVGDGGLYIETVAGKDIVRHFEKLHERIKITAAACGARRLYSYASREAIKRLYDRRTSAEPVATLYREDL